MNAKHHVHHGKQKQHFSFDARPLGERTQKSLMPGTNWYLLTWIFMLRLLWSFFLWPLLLLLLLLILPLFYHQRRPNSEPPSKNGLHECAPDLRRDSIAVLARCVNESDIPSIGNVNIFFLYGHYYYICLRSRSPFRHTTTIRCHCRLTTSQQQQSRCPAGHF